MKSKTMVLVLIAALGIAHAAEYPAPVTPVDVDKDVERELTEDELSALSGGGTLLKTGEGTLVIASDLSSFSGEIRVEKGRLRARHAGALGDTQGGTFVSAGASLVFDGFTADTTIAEPLTIAGPGVDDEGALSAITQTKTVTLSGGLSLSDDAVIKYARPVTLKGTLDLGGGDLSIIGAKNDKNFKLANLTTANAGNISLSNTLFYIDAAVNFAGTADNCLYLNKSAILRDGAKGDTLADWTLVCNGGEFSPYQGGQGAGGYKSNVWPGPVVLEKNTKATEYSWDGVYQNGGAGKTIKGRITGPGGFYVVGGGGGESVFGSPQKGYWAGLLLWNTDNAFEGAIGVTNGVLRLYRNGSYPIANRKPISIKNGTLYLGDPVTQLLPDLHFTGDSGKTVYVRNGNASVSNIVKEGACNLRFQSAVSVLDRFSLKEGTAYLPTLVTGLVEHVEHGLRTNDLSLCSITDDTRYRNNPYWLTTYKSLNDSAKAMWSTNTTIGYSGFIWNRSDQDVTWTFLMNYQVGCELKVNGELVASGNKAACGDAVLHPGANTITMLAWSAAEGDAGLNAWNAQGKNGSYIGSGFGVGYDTQARGTTTAANFKKLQNSDECPLTTTANDRPYDALGRRSVPDIAELEISPGATFNLNDWTYELSGLLNFGTIVNGRLTIGKRWTIEGSAYDPASPLTVDGDLSFAATAEIVLKNGGVFKASSAPYLLCTVTGKLGQLPKGSFADENGNRWRLLAGADGKSVYLTTASGLVLIVR